MVFYTQICFIPAVLWICYFTFLHHLFHHLFILIDLHETVYSVPFTIQSGISTLQNQQCDNGAISHTQAGHKRCISDHVYQYIENHLRHRRSSIINYTYDYAFDDSIPKPLADQLPGNDEEYVIPLPLDAYLEERETPEQNDCQSQMSHETETTVPDNGSLDTETTKGYINVLA